MAARSKYDALSVSVWVRDIELTPEQLARLAAQKSMLGVGREKYIATMRAKRERRIATYYAEADQEFALLAADPVFTFGLALYVGEGSKSGGSSAQISNCDPRVIRKAIRFFLKIGIPWERLRAAIILHPGLSAPA